MSHNGTMHRKRKRLNKIKCGKCIWCEKIIGQSQITLDHKIPRYYGGENNKFNLLIACRTCNQARGAITALYISICEGRAKPNTLLLKYKSIEKSIFWFQNRYKTLGYMYDPPIPGMLNWFRWYMETEFQVIEKYYWTHFRGFK